MSYKVFVSYARMDRSPRGEPSANDHIAQFVEDLSVGIRARIGGDVDKMCFFDTALQTVGVDWTRRINEALGSVQIFLPLLSPTYFQRGFCAQEWHAFEERIAKALPKDQAFRCVVPILWESSRFLTHPLPPGLFESTYVDDSFPKQYAKNGLRVLYELPRYRRYKTEVVDQLSVLIATQLQSATLPPTTDLSPVGQLSNDWIPRETRAVSGSHSSQKPESHRPGPRYARFVFLVPTQGELPPERVGRDAYGDTPHEWRPFLPSFAEDVELMASEVSVAKRLVYERIDYERDKATSAILQGIEHAERAANIVVVIVDAWSVYVGALDNFLKAYDQRNFVNVLMVVPWNHDDTDTRTHISQLRAQLEGALRRRVAFPDSRHFLSDISSIEQLKNALEKTLEELRVKLCWYAEPQRRIEGPSVPRPLIGVTA
jgi:FxsC-like protein